MTLEPISGEVLYNLIIVVNIIALATFGALKYFSANKVNKFALEILSVMRLEYSPSRKAAALIIASDACFLHK